MDRELTQKERNSARRRKYLPYIIGGTALAAGLITLLIASRQSVDREDLLITTVDCGTIETSVTGSGSIVPAFEEIINSPINSRIIEVYCKAGDSVDIGTPLLRLDLQSTETELNKLKDQIQMKNYELEQQKVNNSTRVSDLAMQVKVKEMTVNRLEAELRNVISTASAQAQATACARQNSPSIPGNSNSNRCASSLPTSAKSPPPG